MENEIVTVGPGAACVRINGHTVVVNVDMPVFLGELAGLYDTFRLGAREAPPRHWTLRFTHADTCARWESIIDGVSSYHTYRLE